MSRPILFHNVISASVGRLVYFRAIVSCSRALRTSRRRFASAAAAAEYGRRWALRLRRWIRNQQTGRPPRRPSLKLFARRRTRRELFRLWDDDDGPVPLRKDTGVPKW